MIGLVLLLVAIGLAVADEAADLGTFWQPLPMLTQVVGGLLFLGITVFAVDTVVRRREDRTRHAELAARWRGLGGIPFRSLANGLGDIIDGMAWLVTAEHPLDYPRALPPDDQAALRKRLRAARTRPTSTGDTGAFTSALFDERLARLLGSERWCRFAHDRLDILKWRFRERVGTWAAPMLALDELSAVLARASVVDDTFGSLQRPLGRLARLGHADPEAGDLSDARREWFACLAEAISMREELQWAAHAARGHDAASTASAVGGWKKFRGWLLRDERDALDDRIEDVLRGSARRWHARLQELLRVPLAETSRLLAYWEAIRVYEALPRRTRWFALRPTLPREHDG